MIADINDITSFKWATVTAVSPLAIKLDGDTAELSLVPDSLVDPLSLAINDRVRVELSLRKCVIHGKAGLALFASDTEAIAGVLASKGVTPHALAATLTPALAAAFAAPPAAIPGVYVAEGDATFTTTTLASSGSGTSLGSALSVSSLAYATVLELDFVGVGSNNGAASARTISTSWTTTVGSVTLDHSNSVIVEPSTGPLRASVVNHGRLFVAASATPTVTFFGLANNNLTQMASGRWRWKRRRAYVGETS
jgi:hypothetical protein